MANRFSFGDLFVRVVVSLLLVMGTYNPTKYSYISWVLNESTEFGPVPAIVGLLLLIAWIVFLRATFLSLGWLGVILWGALLACVIWFLVDQGWLTLDSSDAVTWVLLILIAMVLAVGLSWSIIRRQLTGVYATDDVED